MANFLKLTNVFKGNPEDTILINVDHIISIFPILKVSEETNEAKDVTVLFGGEGKIWEVEETVDDIQRMIGSDPVQDGMNTHFQQRMSDAKKIEDLTKT